MNPFIVYPAIDLRGGKVVRLLEGDPNRQTDYSHDPGVTAEQWINHGANWLHVVNLDGAFQEADTANFAAVRTILDKSRNAGVSVQLGGGVQNLFDIEKLLNIGITRVILGSAAAAQPQLAAKAVQMFGAEKILVSIDARDGIVRTRGWQDATALFATDFAAHLSHLGVKWLVYTDISRDGMLQGLNIKATKEVAVRSGLQVIASGGVRGWDDIKDSAQVGLAGAIVGKALYEGLFDPKQLFSFTGETPC